MAQPVQVQVVGAVAAQPSAPSLFNAALQEYLNLEVQATYGSMKGGAVSVAGTDLAPFDLPFEGIAFGRLFALRVDSGPTFEVRVTSSLGVQRHLVSDLLLIHEPVPGSEFTAIQIVGTGDVRYALAGDVS